MPKEGIYYLARLAKMGNLNTDMVIQALLHPKPVVMFGNAWSFTGTKAYETSLVRRICGCFLVPKENKTAPIKLAKRFQPFP